MKLLSECELITVLYINSKKLYLILLKVLNENPNWIFFGYLMKDSGHNRIQS